MQLLTVFALIAVIVLVLGVYVLVKMPGRKQAQILVEPGVPFELRCAPPDEKAYKVWVRYKVAFTGVDGKGESSFGLLFDLKITAGEMSLMREPIAHGFVGFAGVDRVIPTEFFAGTSRTRSDYVRAGSFALAATSSRSHAAEILVRGTIHAAQGTTVELLRVYVAA